MCYSYTYYIIQKYFTPTFNKFGFLVKIRK